MSNSLSIATVTASLRRFLQGVVSTDVDGATVTTVRPTESGAGLPQTGVNVFLYQVTANPELRNLDLPTRRADGSGVQRPAAAVDLHYLFSFYGDQSTLEPQRLLGSVVRTLHARPILTREMIRDTVADPAFGFLAGSDLDAETELVRLVPLNFGLQEMSQLWSGMFQKSEYALSVAYRGSVVLLTADERAAPALPVREPRLLTEILTEPRAEVESNVESLALRPRLTSAETGSVEVKNGRAAATLTLTFESLLGARQKAFVLLNTIAGSPQPAAYSFPVPPRADDAEDANIPLSGVLPAVYLVRLRVDGAESPLDVDVDPASPTFGTFTGPTIDLTGGAQ